MPVSHRLSTLSDQTRVISKRLDGVRAVSLCFWVGCGSRDESGPLNGISHFLEHVVFRGSERYTSNQIADKTDRLGGRFDAETSLDYTLYHLRVLDQDVEKALELVADMLYAPSFNDVELERKIILEEIAEDEDEPDALASALSMKAAYGSHPLSRPIAGSEQTVSAISRADLVNYHAAHYRGADMVIAAAGGIDHDQLAEIAERMAIKRRTPAATPPARELFAGAAPQLLFRQRSVGQYHVHLSLPGISWSDPREAQLVLLRDMVCDLETARLQRSIREERGLVYSLRSYDERFIDCGGAGITLITTADNLDECLEVLAGELEAITADGFTATELERVKQSAKIHSAISEERSMGVARRLGQHVLFGSPLQNADERIAAFDAVDLDDLNKFAAAILATGSRALAAVGPDEDSFRRAAAPLVPALTSLV